MSMKCPRKGNKGRSGKKTVQQTNKAVAQDIENKEKTNIERGWFQNKLMHCLAMLPILIHLA